MSKNLEPKGSKIELEIRSGYLIKSMQIKHIDVPHLDINEKILTDISFDAKSFKPNKNYYHFCAAKSPKNKIIDSCHNLELHPKSIAEERLISVFEHHNFKLKNKSSFFR